MSRAKSLTMQWSERLAADDKCELKIKSYEKSHVPSRQPSLILFSLDVDTVRANSVSYALS